MPSVWPFIALLPAAASFNGMPLTIKPAAWLASASKGYCGETDDRERGDCEIGDQGNLGLPNSATLTWAAASRECLRRCADCSRCNFVSLSISFKDCSWYRQCTSLKHKVNGFRSGLAKNLSLALSKRRQKPVQRGEQTKRASLRMRTEGTPTQWPWFAPHSAVHVALLLCGKIGTLADPSSWVPPDKVWNVARPYN